MEPPFYNIHYQIPKAPQLLRIPVNMRPTMASSRPRKVIYIPIHDENSLRKMTDSALRIQKVFRGFRVRKTVDKILELKREVDAVEKKLLERETMAAIKRDMVERLKVSESLMVLLFKLDSVRGFNDEIRVSRKMVIRKAIRLQELIDSAIDEIAGDNCKEDLEDADDISESLSKMQVEDSEKLEEESEVAVDAMQVETVTGSDETWECVSGETEEQKSDVVEAAKEDDHGYVKEDCEEKGTPPPKEDWFVVGGDEAEEKRKLLEKMAADNDRLMADLCQKNVVQSRSICSLSQRIEQLEKALSERLRKKSNATTQI